MNNYKTKILIIVPTLNSFHLLPKLINSLYSQTCKSWNVLFVDGDSSEDHRKFIKEICLNDKRFYFVEQKKKYKGIYGAMNLGFNFSDNYDWFFFWGSDDWLENKFVFEKIFNKIDDYKNKKYNLFIFKGKYINTKGKLVRETKFLNLFSLKLSIFFGFIPPHQATMISKSCLKIVNEYDHNYTLAGDLDYFLKLSMDKNLKIKFVNFNIINISEGGISQRKNILRISEVIKAYKSVFGYFFIFPLLNRYFIRLFSMIF